MRALAGLHGPTWCDPRWTDFPGLAMSLASEDAVKGLGDIAVMATQITLERLGSRMTAEDRETATEAMSMATPWLMADRHRFSLLHGDYRLDNMLFDPDRTRVTVVDWQTLGVGLPARDLAYFTGTSLLPEARSAGGRATSSPPTTRSCRLTASPTTTARRAGATTGSACCRCPCSRPSAAPSPSPPSAVTT